MVENVNYQALWRGKKPLSCSICWFPWYEILPLWLILSHNDLGVEKGWAQLVHSGTHSQQTLHLFYSRMGCFPNCYTISKIFFSCSYDDFKNTKLKFMSDFSIFFNGSSQCFCDVVFLLAYTVYSNKGRNFHWFKKIYTWWKNLETLKFKLFRVKM